MGDENGDLAKVSSRQVEKFTGQLQGDIGMSTQALIELVETHWSGWVPGGASNSTSARVWAEEKTKMSPETFGQMKADYPDFADSFYELVVDRIVKDVVVFGYRNLVVENRDGTINLSAPQVDKFILRWGETKRLSTATMDAGTSVTVKVVEIRTT